jgi:hypothetical protein
MIFCVRKEELPPRCGASGQNSDESGAKKRRVAVKTRLLHAKISGIQKGDCHILCGVKWQSPFGSDLTVLAG